MSAVVNSTPLDSKELGKLFKYFRTKKKLTLREVEKLTGISNAFISQFENGANISYDYYCKLANCYGLKVCLEEINK